VIHGDLSPYNILAGAEGPTIIDFPQVISPAHASRPEFFFQRDFDNVFRYLAAADPSLAPHAGDGRMIWRAYAARDLTPDFVPPIEARRPAPAPSHARAPEQRGRAMPSVEYRPARGGGRPQAHPHPHPPRPPQVPHVATASGPSSRPIETAPRPPQARSRRRRRRG
jgi:RIO kinase 1